MLLSEMSRLVLQEVGGQRLRQRHGNHHKQDHDQHPEELTVLQKVGVTLAFRMRQHFLFPGHENNG